MWNDGQVVELVDIRASETRAHRGVRVRLPPWLLSCPRGVPVAHQFAKLKAPGSIPGGDARCAGEAQSVVRRFRKATGEGSIPSIGSVFDKLRLVKIAGVAQLARASPS